MICLASLTEETSDRLNGYHVIKTKEELDRFVADNSQSHRITIRGDFAREYFTPTGLQEYVQNAKAINKSLIITLDEKSEVMTDLRFIERLKRVQSMEECIILITTYPKEFIDTIKMLSTNVIDNSQEMLAASNAVSRLQSTIDALLKEKADVEYALKVEQDNKLQVQSKFDTLVKRINYQYNVGIDEKHMFDVDSNAYDKVIYIKEISRVQYVDSFVYYLKEILKILYNMPARLTVIESYYADGKINLYPRLCPHHSLSETDVISGDILMLGLQPKLMQDILRNPSNISILIVLDRAGFKKPHIRGNNVEYFYTVSDLKDAPEDIPKDRIISYEESTLFIPYIPDFGKLDEEARITKYSSIGIIKKMIALLEGR